MSVLLNFNLFAYFFLGDISVPRYINSSSPNPNLGRRERKFTRAPVNMQIQPFSVSFSLYFL
jgi:hypothetical protein